MSKQLYEEALADVKKLKEIAEDNAKKALIEAVSPRIKDLIEAELLREVEEDVDVSEGDELLASDSDGMTTSASRTKPTAPSASTTDPETGAGPADTTTEADHEKASAESVSEVYELSSESFDFLSSTSKKTSELESLKMESQIFKLHESIEQFLNAGEFVKKSSGFKRAITEMVSEVEGAYEYLQESAGDLHGKEIYEEKLEDLYKKLNKLVEQDNMKKTNVLDEAKVEFEVNFPFDISDEDLEGIEIDLVKGDEESSDELEDAEEPSAEGGAEEEPAEEPMDLSAEPSEDEEAAEEKPMESRRLSDDMIVEIDEGMLRNEISRMRALREAAESEDVQAWGHGAGKVSSEEDFEADDLGDPFVDVDLSEGMYEDSAHDELTELEQAADDDSSTRRGNKRNRSTPHGKDPIHDSVEEKLAHEEKIQTEARDKARKAKKSSLKEKSSCGMAQDDSRRAAKKGDKHTAEQKRKKAKMHELAAARFEAEYTKYAKIFNESVLRSERLNKVLAESQNEVRRNGTSPRSSEETTVLRTKLAETNLFNTKLLYCNKLLQNESLTKRQKAEVIERLEEAKSEREVKLVYESLVKTLTPSRQISEGAERVLGSSSRATRPASTVLSESYEADRWARLAGIK